MTDRLHPITYISSVVIKFDNIRWRWEDRMLSFAAQFTKAAPYLPYFGNPKSVWASRKHIKNSNEYLQCADIKAHESVELLANPSVRCLFFKNAVI